MKGSVLLSCTALTILIGCASTKITAITDPAYRHITYDKLLVVAALSNIEYRQITETRFQSEFQKEGLDALASINVLPPTRQLSDDELAAVLTQNNVQAVLIIALSDYWESQSYIPPSSKTSTTGKATIINNSIYYSQERQTSTSGGYYLSTPNATFGLRLYDLNSGDVVWLAQTLTQGDVFSNFSTLVKSLAHTSVDQLRSEELISSPLAPAGETPNKTFFMNYPLPVNHEATTTRLPNFRAAMPRAAKYSDSDIIQMFMEKFPRLRQKSQAELIELIEAKYATD